MVESYQSHGLELIVTGVSLNHPAFQKKQPLITDQRHKCEHRCCAVGVRRCPPAVLGMMIYLILVYIKNWPDSTILKHSIGGQ